LHLNTTKLLPTGVHANALAGQAVHTDDELR